MERQALLRHSRQPGDRAPAPGGLELVQAFVNTVDREHGPDLFAEAGGAAEWLAARGFAASAVTTADCARLVTAREAIRRLLLVNTGHAAPAALPDLDAALASAPMLVGFDDGGPRLRPAKTGVDGALAAVAAEIVHAVADGTWGRLKACPGHDCGWAFYDRSRNQGSTWCSMRVCGGRAKAAAYYRRRRAG